jgi:hypothetical protein
MRRERNLCAPTLPQGTRGVGGRSGRLRPGLSAQVQTGSEPRRGIALYLVSYALNGNISENSFENGNC